MTVVVQGFGPFGAFAENPSERIVRALGQTAPELVTEVLPVSMRAVAEAVPALVKRHRPDVWIGVGLAAGRASLGVEAVGVNLASWSAQDADVEGMSAPRRPIVEGGPAAYVTTLPVAGILAAWGAAGLPGFVSLSAGSYLCNLSLYLASHAAAMGGRACRVGFIHVPLLPELVTEPERQPSVGFSAQLEGLRCVLDACAAAPPDAGLYEPGAAVHPGGDLEPY